MTLMRSIQDMVWGSTTEAVEDGETTPKAKPQDDRASIPALNLGDASEIRKPSESSPPSSKQQIPERTIGSMPPPMRAPSKTTSLAPPPSVSSGLRVPNSGPLPNRGPNVPQKTATQGGLVPVANTAGKRNKVLLKPGHSPLDWATLTKNNNLSGVPSMQRVTPSMLKYHHGRKGRPAWSSYRGKVYNISPYLPFHPGGEGEMMRAAGKDGEKLFMDIHPWVNWDNMLQSCLVGIMVSEGDGEGLDGLD